MQDISSHLTVSKRSAYGQYHLKWELSHQRENELKKKRNQLLQIPDESQEPERRLWQQGWRQEDEEYLKIKQAKGTNLQLEDEYVLEI